MPSDEPVMKIRAILKRKEMMKLNLVEETWVQFQTRG
jgi:hypothetical protein